MMQIASVLERNKPDVYLDVLDSYKVRKDPEGNIEVQFLYPSHVDINNRVVKWEYLRSELKEFESDMSFINAGIAVLPMLKRPRLNSSHFNILNDEDIRDVPMLESENLPGSDMEDTKIQSDEVNNIEKIQSREIENTGHVVSSKLKSLNIYIKGDNLKVTITQNTVDEQLSWNYSLKFYDALCIDISKLFDGIYQVKGLPFKRGELRAPIFISDNKTNTTHVDIRDCEQITIDGLSTEAYRLNFFGKSEVEWTYTNDTSISFCKDMYSIIGYVGYVLLARQNEAYPGLSGKEIKDALMKSINKNNGKLK